MGCCCSSPEIEYEINKISDFEFPKITQDIINEIEKKVEKETGFKPYGEMTITLNKNRSKIKGTYFQYNKGCILYALINNGYIDEKFIPDSLKYYIDRSHKEDAINDTNLLRKTISLIDLAQLWMNIGGECPYLEISLKEARERIYFALKRYFDYVEPNNEKEKTNLMKKINSMTWQSKDYFELLGKVKIEYTPLTKISELNDNPCIKNAIDKNFIKKRDIIKYGRHCFIFDDLIEVDSKRQYSFQDSLAYFRRDDKKEKNYNNCDFSKKGFIFAEDDSKFININDSKEKEIGIVKIII